ncbi:MULTISPECIES: helix-turn-helix domain-containing protein [unclassified Sphingobacterium]|uniref:helix-turn-helix domain-containing protein n=1 Tax=unclassified Sphingobacterium TaxID=2609468 RepID=UPI002952F919|nr:helix-turn-helix domain-containing protein [Sphingobacterium sp. UGAL515B_05]WON93587.1 AraC family transcriptional regulator [Sphingobacterium sp. UGAL515B_05]
MKPKEDTYLSYKISARKEFEAVFSHFYYAENKSEHTITKTLLPSFQTIMVFNFGTQAFLVSKQKTKIEVDKCIVLGPIKSAFEYSLPPDSNILVANFKGDAFYRFFGRALLSNHLPVHPDEVMEENCFTHLWFQLNSIDSTEEKVDHILNFCKSYLNQQNTTSHLLANFRSDTMNSIKSIAEETKQTERNIQLIHKRHFGFSAKEVNRYHRFSKAIELIQKTDLSKEKVNWFEIIDQCGYYDQSQLIHDFKHFINLSPKNYLKFQRDICRAGE